MVTSSPSSFSTSGQNTEVVVHTSLGRVRGLERGGCFVFRGVPYAEAPVRFRRPTPKRPWTGELDCTRYGKIAVQLLLKPPSPKTVGKIVLGALGFTPKASIEPLPPQVSEDCLFLNITTLSLTGNAPVLCWIHGGAFVFGSGSDGVYRSNAITRKENVVLVTINYRLGCFGFLNIPGGDPNCGIWDQLEALRWIRAEIRNFGGDPSRVTIVGESAGAMSCGTLLTSPLAQPFFHRAILMSGALSNVMRFEDAAAVARAFCKSVGKEMNAESLRCVPPEELLAAQRKVRGIMPFQPCVDGVLVPHRALDAVVDRRISLAGKQVMIGCTAKEYNLFDPRPAIMHTWKPVGTVLKRTLAHLGPLRMATVGAPHHILVERVSTLLKRIREERSLSNWGEVEKELFSSLIFHAPARLAAEALSQTADGVFVYSFDFDAGRLGAAHASELPLLFGTYEKHWFFGEISGARREPAAAEALSNSLMARIGSFARDGSPNYIGGDQAEQTLDWPKYVAQSAPFVFIFDRECKVVREGYGSVLCEVKDLLRNTPRPFGVLHSTSERSKL